MTSFRFVFLAKCYQDYQIIGDVVGGECSTCWERSAYPVWHVKPAGTRQFGRLRHRWDKISFFNVYLTYCTYKEN
jgi:hypothetical protein